MAVTKFSFQDKKLYRAFGVLWKPILGAYGIHLSKMPHCPNDSCHTMLQIKGEGWFCVKCDSLYPYTVNYQADHEHAELMWNGYQTLDWDVYSLELPPTKVSAGDEDDNYWVKAKIGEKNGKRMAVVYFGEKVRGKQDKTDYSQLFIDLEDEQIRFDRNNKNPMKVLCKLSAEFENSIAEQKKK